VATPASRWVLTEDRFTTPSTDYRALSTYYPEAHGTVGAGADSAAIQAACDTAFTAGGGIVLLSAIGGYVIDTPITVRSRVRLLGASSSGAIKIKAINGLNSSMFYLGATDGSDPNWHWGELGYLYLDGNKANQTRPAAVTITAATTSGYVGTITAAGHGLAVGDFTEITGVTPAGYNGRWRVESVTSSSVYTITHLSNALGAGSVFGTSRELCNIVNVGKGGETSIIHNIYTDSATNSSFIQGTIGTPMRYENCSAFNAGDYGFDIWNDRPVQMDTPSGDSNGLGLIHLAGTASAGGTGTDSACVINNIKAEKHTVPVLLLDDYDGSVVMNGGSIDMDATNTGAAIRRTSASANSSLHANGVRINPRVSGTVIFKDDASSGYNVTSTASGAETWSFFIYRQPFSAVRFAQRRNDLTDGATVTPNLQNGTYCKLVAGGSRTIAAPTNPPLGSPNAMLVIFDITNNTAGAITTTWNSAFKMASWVDPAAAKRRTLAFWWDGSNYVQVGTVSPDLT